MKTDWEKTLSLVMHLLEWIALIASVVALIYPSSNILSNPADSLAFSKRFKTPAFSGVIKANAKERNTFYTSNIENVLLASLNQDNLFLTKEKMRIDELLSWVAIGTGGAGILTSLILTILAINADSQANSAYNNYLNSFTQSSMDRYYNDHVSYIDKYNRFLISAIVVGLVGISALLSGIIVLVVYKKRQNKATNYITGKTKIGSFIQPLFQTRF